MDTLLGLGLDWFEAEIRDGDDNTLTTLQALHDSDSYYRDVWRQETFIMMGPEYAGRTIRLHFGARAWFPLFIFTYWYIDDVGLNACLTPSAPLAITSYLPIILKNHP